MSHPRWPGGKAGRSPAAERRAQGARSLGGPSPASTPAGQGSETGFLPVLYLCTPGSWGSVSQVSCSSCCRRSPATAAACPSPCPALLRRPPPAAASRWTAVGGCLRRDPRRPPAPCCCPPRRMGTGSGCAGCPAGAGTGRLLG